MGDTAVKDINQSQVGQEEKHGRFQRGILQNCHNNEDIPRKNGDTKEQQKNTK